MGAPPTAAETAYFTGSESQYSASNVDTSFSIANLNIDSSWGGSIGVSGSLTISGNLILASGTLGGSGAISVAGSGSQFSGGTLGGNVTNAGTLTVSGSGSEYLGGTLTNTGTIDVTGSGAIYAYASNATINNQAGAVFDFESNGLLSNFYGYANPTFNNAGTLEMTAGSGTSSVGFALNESGATSVLSNASAGTLSLSDGGSIGGTVTVSGAETLAGGTFTVADGTTIAPPSGGSGSLQVAGGTLSLAGSLSTTVLAIAGGTLGGIGTIAAGSQVTWSGGTLAGAVTNAGTLAISGNEEYLGGTLTNTGTIDVTGSGAIYAYASNATINNQAGAVFDFESNGLLSNFYGYANPTFNNAGTLEMTAGSGTSSVGFALNESGATSVLSNASAGTLSLSDGGSIGGTVTVSGAETLAGGTFTVADGTTIAPPSGGSGSLQVAGGTLSLAGSLSTTVLAIAGGTLGGIGTIAAGSQVTWSGGTLAGAVTNAGTLAISGNEEYLGGTLTNTGTIDVTGSGAIYAYAPNATINNQAGAVFDFESNGLLSNFYGYANPTFNNAGTLEMTAGTGTSSVAFTLNNTVGTVNALSGTLDLPNSALVSSGTLGFGTWVVGPNSTLTISGVSSISTLSANVTLQGSGATFTGISSLSQITAAGELELQNGAFTTAGNLDNSGTIDLAAGTLNVAGTYTQESTGAYDVGIGGITPGSSYGQLNVSQSASLNGDLDVSLINTTPRRREIATRFSRSPRRPVTSPPSSGSISGGGEGFSPTFSPSTNPTALDLVVIRRVGGHPDDRPVVGESLELRRYRHVHGHGDADRLDAPRPDRTGHVLRRLDRRRHRDARQRLGHLRHLHPRGRHVLDHRAVRRRLQLQRQQLGGPHPDRQSERQPDRPPIVGEPVELWRSGHVHGDGLARLLGLGHRDADRPGRVLRRLDAPGHRDLERRHGQLHHVGLPLGPINRSRRSIWATPITTRATSRFRRL